MMNIVLLSILSLVLLSLLAACSYGHKKYDQSEGSFQEPNDFVVQIDDYGNFWDRGVPERAISTIVESSKKTNTIVVLFIHGWHHNAHISDGNAKDFSKSLVSIRKKLYDVSNGVAGPYRNSRERLTGTGGNFSISRGKH